GDPHSQGGGRRDLARPERAAVDRHRRAPRGAAGRGPAGHGLGDRRRRDPGGLELHRARIPAQARPATVAGPGLGGSRIIAFHRTRRQFIMSSPDQAASLTVEGDIGVVTRNPPPVNALSQAVRAGILENVNKAVADPAVKAIVLICEGRTFIAGADITEFGKPRKAPSLPEAQNAIENSPKPVIAAIHGTALGGGFEVALCCHYRVAVPSARCGLPEVKLGLLP